MTTPTQTEYGPEIVVDGVRPDGLTGDVSPCIVKTADLWCTWLDPYDPTPAENWAWSHDNGMPNITAIKLRADHPLYTVLNHNAKHGTQFKYWPGGDEAPGDWDYGPLFVSRDGCLRGFGDPQFNHFGVGTDIIGYTPKPCAASIHSADATVDVVKRLREDIEHADKMERMMQAHDTAQPDFVPCERTLMLAIEALPHGDCGEADPAWMTGVNSCQAILHQLLPKKDRAEEIVSKFIGSVDDDPHIDTDARMKRLITALIAQGEIRG